MIDFCQTNVNGSNIEIWQILFFITNALKEQFFSLILHQKAAGYMGIGLCGCEKAVFAVALTGIFRHVFDNILRLLPFAAR